MKVFLLICTLVINHVLAENSIAVNYAKVNRGNNQNPVSTASDIGRLDEKASPETIDSLMQKLYDPDPFVRVEAIQALGEIRHNKSLVSVCGCLKDENLYVRAYAAEALGKIGHLDSTFALEQLFSALDDPSPYVRAMVILALGDLQDKRSTNSIRKLLNDDDENVRRMAAWALHKIENSQ